MQHKHDQCSEYGCGALLLTLDEVREGMCERHQMIRAWAELRPLIYSDEFRAAMKRRAQDERQAQ